MTKHLIQLIFSIVSILIYWNKTKTKRFDLAMNVSLSSLERLLHRYTMEPTNKPFDVRSVPVEAVPVEQPKG
jgi:hypothetical protein